MTSDPTGPVLACFDRSDGSRAALQQARSLIGAREVVILSVWQTVITQFATTGIFRSGVALPNEEELDQAEEQAAQAAAEAGAEQARAHGLTATARVERAQAAVGETIVAVADEIDAELIVCGSRGRGPLSRALVGSTSEYLLRHARRPVLLVPISPGD